MILDKEPYLEEKIKHVTVNTTSDVNGNALVLSGYIGGLVISFLPSSGSADCFYTIFTSSATQHTYVHCSDWDGSNKGVVAVKGEVYYLLKPQ